MGEIPAVWLFAMAFPAGVGMLVISIGVIAAMDYWRRD